MLHSLLHHPRLHPHLSHFITSSSSSSSLYSSLPLLLLLLILHHLFGLLYNLLILLLRLPPPSLLLLLLFSPLLSFLILSFLSTLRHVRLVAPPFCISARCSFYSPTAGLYLAPSSSHLAPVTDASYEIFSWSAPFCPYTLSVHYVLLYSTFCFYPSDLPLSFSHVSTLPYAVLVSWLAPSPFMLYRSTRANEPRSSLKRCLLDPLITRWRARLHGV